MTNNVPKPNNRRSIASRAAAFTRLKWLLLLCVFLMSNPAAYAHSLGEGYIFIRVYETNIEGRIEATLDDLNDALILDDNHDGKVSASELDAHIGKVHQYLEQRIGLTDTHTAYPIHFTTHEVLDTAIGPYGVIHFKADTPTPVPDLLTAEYNLFFDVDPQHRGILVIELNQKISQDLDSETAAAIFQPNHRQIEIDLTVPVHSNVFLEFLWHGVWHIWIGIDHILFLIAFVMQTVVFLKDRKWVPVQGFRPAFWGAVKIVTLFTIAHSITLTLATLGLVNLPSRLVESVIAASVVIAALNALVPVIGGHIGPVIFAFGLFHGFGFASVLVHLGLQQTSLAVPLVAFNLGVEIGQLIVICMTLPVCYLLSRSKRYPETTLRCAAAIIAFIALMWLIERAFVLEPILEI